MNVACVIVGINQWEEYTLPLIESIQKHEPDVRIIVIDNASEEPYPFRTSEFPVDVLRMPERVCYSAAINYGMRVSEADWTIVLNNDVLCTASFTELLEWMHPEAVYGNQLIVFKGLRWLGLWLFVISREVWENVGEFDEQFEVCGFEDADYCFRAHADGFEINRCALPFHHYWGKTRWDVPGYEQIREENKRRLEEKHGVSLAGEWEVFN